MAVDRFDTCATFACANRDKGTTAHELGIDAMAVCLQPAVAIVWDFPLTNPAAFARGWLWPSEGTSAEHPQDLKTCFRNML